MRLIFVRHGESLSNAAPEAVDLPAGQGDQLSELGLRQAAEAAEGLRACGATRIYASALNRAQQTAAPIAEALGLEAETAEEIREIHQRLDYGDLAPEDQVAERWSEWMADHADDPDYSREGGETFNQIVARVHEFKARLDRDCSPNDIVLAVSHGIYQRFFLFDSILADRFSPAITRRLWQIRTVNCGASVFDRAPGGGPNQMQRHPLDPSVDGWVCASWMNRPWDPV